MGVGGGRDRRRRRRRGCGCSTRRGGRSSRFALRTGSKLTGAHVSCLLTLIFRVWLLHLLEKETDVSLKGVSHPRGLLPPALSLLCSRRDWPYAGSESAAGYASTVTSALAETGVSVPSAAMSSARRGTKRHQYNCYFFLRLDSRLAPHTSPALQPLLPLSTSPSPCRGRCGHARRQMFRLA